MIGPFTLRSVGTFGGAGQGVLLTGDTMVRRAAAAHVGETVWLVERGAHMPSTATTETARDTDRALAAAREIFDERDGADHAAIMVTLEHAVATVLLAAYGGDARKAAGMLNEGLLPRVEERIALYAARRRTGS